VALDLPPDGSKRLLHAMRRRAEWERLPVVALTDTHEQAKAAPTAGFQDCQGKFDRARLLECVARFAATEAVAAGAAP